MSLTAEETKALEATNRALEAGEDPFGDDEDIVASLPEGEGDDTDPGNTTDDDDGDPDDKKTDGDPAADAAARESAAAEAAALAEIANGKQQEATQAPAARPFDAKVPEDYKAQRNTLLSEKSAAMKQLMDGEIDADAYAAIETRVADQLEELTATRIRAETLIEANTQTAQQSQQAAINQLIARTKEQVDYAADAKARKQFDQSMAIIASDPDNAGMDYATLINETHKVVAAMRGIVAGDNKPGASTAKPGERKPDGEAPVTLRDLPSAAVSNSNGNMIDQIARLKGPEYEQAFAKLSPAQRRSLLDEDE